ncbi:hypothetical protein LCGC14_1177830 [marine sediment metagenome]|jgi:hypothetical protein|uniref:HTH merR-type domain-containing protein n=1 Tax=marine sediment metagenome TaxID=412755 RepID=A0A0F9PTG0_9ZZZZ
MQKYKTIPDLLSSREAAAEIGIAPTTLKYHARRNQIGFFQIANGKQRMYLFTRQDISRFKKGQKPIDPAKR